MTKNNKSNNQEELFARDCKLMNLKYEYDGYTGTEKWAVVTELTEEELWDGYQNTQAPAELQYSSDGRYFEAADCS